MNKALFLDRDGIINVDHGYVYKIEEFEFMPNIFELCKIANDKGYLIVVITNQSGIGRGRYSENDFHILSKWMVEQFLKQGIKIAEVFYCPHHPEKAFNHYLKQCNCRKPAPGLINQAVKKYNIDVNNSIFIGDKPSDMHAAQAGNIKTKVFFSENIHENYPFDVITIDDLAEISSIF